MEREYQYQQIISRSGQEVGEKVGQEVGESSLWTDKEYKNEKKRRGGGIHAILGRKRF